MPGFRLGYPIEMPPVESPNALSMLGESAGVFRQLEPVGDSLGGLGLVRHFRRWKNGPIALLSARLAVWDLLHDPYVTLGRISPTGSY